MANKSQDLTSCSFLVLSRFANSGEWDVVGYSSLLPEVADMFACRALHYQENPIILKISQLQATMTGTKVAIGQFDIFNPADTVSCPTCGGLICDVEEH